MESSDRVAKGRANWKEPDSREMKEMKVRKDGKCFILQSQLSALVQVLSTEDIIEGNEE